MTARVLAGLLVPADAGRPLVLRAVADSAAAISDLLGGVLLDDAVTWNLGGGVCVSVYWAEDRADLPVNERLSVLATRLGIVERTFHATARGDALLLGVTRQGRDVDVPGTVTVAADRCGYPVAPLAAPAPALVEAALTGHAGYQTGPVNGPSLLPGSRPHAPHADRWEWTLARRARQLYLDPGTLAGDLARIGLPVPVNRLGAMLVGDEPAPPVVLAGLVEVLELRDPAVGDRPLIWAVARSWRYVGWPAPTEILTILAVARNLSVSEIRDIAAQDTPVP